MKRRRLPKREGASDCQKTSESSRGVRPSPAAAAAAAGFGGGGATRPLPRTPTPGPRPAAVPPGAGGEGRSPSPHPSPTRLASLAWRMCEMADKLRWGSGGARSEAEPPPARARRQRLPSIRKECCGFEEFGNSNLWFPNSCQNRRQQVAVGPADRQRVGAGTVRPAIRSGAWRNRLARARGGGWRSSR